MVITGVELADLVVTRYVTVYGCWCGLLRVHPSRERAVVPVWIAEVCTEMVPTFVRHDRPKLALKRNASLSHRPIRVSNVVRSKYDLGQGFIGRHLLDCAQNDRDRASVEEGIAGYLPGNLQTHEIGPKRS